MAYKLAQQRETKNASTLNPRTSRVLRGALSIGSYSMSELREAPEERLYERIAAILDEARSRVARTVNTAMVQAYWLVGREIVEVEQLKAAAHP